jgi:DNA-binding NarL/FixJ family response regulator
VAGRAAGRRGAGAHSYLLEGARRAEIIRAIIAVGNGEAIFGATIAARLIGYFSVPGDPAERTHSPS